MNFKIGNDDWEALWQEGRTPWDMGQAHQDFVRLMDTSPLLQSDQFSDQPDK